MQYAEEYLDIEQSNLESCLQDRRPRNMPLLLQRATEISQKDPNIDKEHKSWRLSIGDRLKQFRLSNRESVTSNGGPEENHESQENIEVCRESKKVRWGFESSGSRAHLDSETTAWVQAGARTSQRMKDSLLDFSWIG